MNNLIKFLTLITAFSTVFSVYSIFVFNFQKSLKTISYTFTNPISKIEFKVKKKAPIKKMITFKPVKEKKINFSTKDEPIRFITIKKKITRTTSKIRLKPFKVKVEKLVVKNTRTFNLKLERPNLENNEKSFDVVADFNVNELIKNLDKTKVLLAKVDKVEIPKSKVKDEVKQIVSASEKIEEKIDNGSNNEDSILNEEHLMAVDKIVEKRLKQKPKKELEVIIPKDEIVLYDYSNPKVKEFPKVVNKPKKKVDKSNNLKDYSIGFVKKMNAPKKTKPTSGKKVEDKFKYILASVDKIKGSKNDYSKNKEVSSQKSRVENLFATTKMNSHFNSTVYINVDHVLINNKVDRKHTNYEVQFIDDYKEFYNDYGDGVVKIEKSLNSKVSSRMAKIKSPTAYITNTEIVFENDKIQLNIPVLERASFDTLLREHEIYGGGHVLVELDSSTEDVSLDVSASKKLFLNNKFKVIDRSVDEYSYILFLGVIPGNRIITYKRNNHQIVSRISFVSQDEIYFDSNFYETFENEKLVFRKVDILTKKKEKYDLNINEIRFLSNDVTPEKENLNTFKFSKLTNPLGYRKYFEVKLKKDSVFVGTQKNNKIDLPTEDYISEILSRFKLDNFKGNCVVQLNLSNKLKEIFIEGVVGNYVMKLDSLILDSNGMFYEEPDVNTEKVFIKGEVNQNNGMINILLKNFDGTEEYITTFCSDQTYLVEQL